MQKKHLKIFSFIAVVLVFGLCFSWVNANYQIENPLGDSSDIFDIIDRVLSFLLWAAITMGVFVIMWAGYIYMTSQGKPEKAAMAGRVIFNVLIGIAIILLSKGIISLTHYVLTGEPTTVWEEVSGPGKISPPTNDGAGFVPLSGTEGITIDENVSVPVDSSFIPPNSPGGSGSNWDFGSF